MRPNYPTKSNDVYVTRKMLFEVRDELKSEILSLDLRMQAGFKQMDSRFEKMSADLHYMKVLMEEQNNKNNIVLEGLANLFERQDRTEAKQKGFEQLLKDLSRR